jgi:acyl-[acyl-carrier-protein]-phospholipid O-acyltransferase/long-chain-fatty-acid--[acyl-carrier-protein] ligase
VREETHRVFADKFGGVMVLEGYGATETAPVIAVNHPPATARARSAPCCPPWRPVWSRWTASRAADACSSAGPNVMAGYIEKGATDPTPLPGGWHDTGDVVAIGDDRVVTILGRGEAFAKIGGEMVSLQAVEDIVAALWPDRKHAVVSTPDPRKGERLVLVTDHPDADGSALAAYAREQGAPELAVPKKILKVPEVPLLGSGKTDYAAIQRLAETKDEAA